MPYFFAYTDDLTDAIMGCYTPLGGLGDRIDGQECVENAQCQSGLCLPIVPESEGWFCTRPCLLGADCGGAQVCRNQGMSLLSEYLFETGGGDLGAWSLVRLCDFPTGEPDDD